ncbi:HlyD family secretion protein [Microbulbifer echini]|uniref:HlyD family secretion protein n=1 Tax=Microbulbifer echini TaxID=1529067 RepID=A0ABV4NLT2_9GAMM|nr:biotin/lipoyl-binding protein [uncultured Microbulbifer sp.]
MRTIRKHIRPDNLDSEIRPHHSAIGRRIYIGVLILFALGIIRYLFGDMFLLKGDGLVLRDYAAVEMGYITRVTAVEVDEGQSVKEGDLLLKIESMELLERLADLSARQANLIQISAEFTLLSETAKQLLVPAEHRKREVEEIIARINKLADKGFISKISYQEVLRDNFDAGQALVKIQVESTTLDKKRKAVESAIKVSAEAFQKLKKHYDDGQVRSPVSGLVGATVPSVGDVYREGEPLMQVFWGEPYVLAYLPRRYLLSIKPGMVVTLKSGRYKDKGVISELLPLSAQLPEEFQNTFKPQERNQLAKITLTDPEMFPVSEKVNVTLEINWKDIIVENFMN